MRRLFAGFLLLSSCAAADHSPSAPPAPPPETPSVMPEFAPHVGVVSVRIDGDDVTLSASFGIDAERCEALVRDGACASERCTPPLRDFQIVPDAGVIEIARPNGRVH